MSVIGSIRACWPAAVLGSVLIGVAGSPTPVAAQAQIQDDCFRQLFDGKAPEIACRFPTRLTEKEKADLKRITKDVLQDALCHVDIRIDRQRVDAAIAGDDHVFEAPPQPMTCEIITEQRKIPVTGTFSPRVVFKGGRAVEGSPGLANVTGVPGGLSWPVVLYVNKSPTVRRSMLEIINAVADETRKRRSR